MKDSTISIVELIGSNLFISAEDGQKVFEQTYQLLEEGYVVTLSFERMEMIISLFLNVAIGQLYGTKLDESILKNNLHFTNISQDDKDLLEQVVDNAKKYYANKENYDKAWKDTIDEE